MVVEEAVPVEESTETPVEETPVEETPVEETPTEETPTEETPVEEEQTVISHPAAPVISEMETSDSVLPDTAFASLGTL